VIRLGLSANRHRWILGLLLAFNAIAFAGVDPVTRALTALGALLLVLDLRTVPSVPQAHLIAIAGTIVVAVVQLVPLPISVRTFLQPGLAELVPDGWAPLSACPWCTLSSLASLLVAVAIALTAARMGSTRSGLPTLLIFLTAACGLLGILGLIGETGASGQVLVLREATRGGGPYGPYVNENHFAVGMELTLPAAVALLAVSVRHLILPGVARRRSAVLALSAGVAATIGLAALIRSGSRGGLLIPGVALALTVLLWRRPARGTRWWWGVVVLAVAAGAAVLAWNRLPEVRDELAQLLVVEGVEGQGRWDFWQSTLELAGKTPFFGVGLGSYKHATGITKPPTGSSLLEHAHSDWLEWLATGGSIGAVFLIIAIAWCIATLRPSRVRPLRFEHRYPKAAAAWTLLAVAAHEQLGSALHTPFNRLLLACWIGLLWALAKHSGTARADRHHRPGTSDTEHAEPVAFIEMATADQPSDKGPSHADDPPSES
jgi:O-antigen ligase